MPITTQDCKNFIADVIQTNPSIVLSIYGYKDPTAPNAASLLKDATNPKMWKRLYKCKPGGGNHEFEEYALFSKTKPIIRMGYDALPKEDAANFVSERGFILNDDIYDTGVCFVVLERPNGALVLGDYIGD
jgi:hypothetical protein